MRFANEGGNVAVVDLNEQHGNEPWTPSRRPGEAIFVKCDVGKSRMSKRRSRRRSGRGKRSISSSTTRR